MWRTEAKLFTERHIPPTASLRLITGSPLTNWWIDFSVLAYHFKEHVGMTSVPEPISKTPVAREWSAETSDGQIHYFFIHLQALALNYEICSVCISLTRQVYMFSIVLKKFVQISEYAAITLMWGITQTHTENLVGCNLYNDNWDLEVMQCSLRANCYEIVKLARILSENSHSNWINLTTSSCSKNQLCCRQNSESMI